MPIRIPENCRGDCSTVLYDIPAFEGADRVDAYACEGKIDRATCEKEVGQFYQNVGRKVRTVLHIPGLSRDAAWHLKVQLHSRGKAETSEENVQQVLDDFGGRLTKSARPQSH